VFGNEKPNRGIQNSEGINTDGHRNKITDLSEEELTPLLATGETPKSSRRRRKRGEKSGGRKVQ